MTGIRSALTRYWTGSIVETPGYWAEEMFTVICWNPMVALASG